MGFPPSESHRPGVNRASEGSRRRDYVWQFPWLAEPGERCEHPGLGQEEAAAHTYVAGAKLEGDKLLTSGGRVVGTTAVAGSLEAAVKEAYRLADGVVFENAYRRSDIGQKGLATYK